MEQHGMTPTPLNSPEGEATALGSLVTVDRPLILLVEDDFMLRGSLAAVLQSEGYRVESAANALEALDRLTRPPKPSLILLDIMLPYMDGLEFRALQRAAPDMADIPVIVITAVGLRPDVAAELDLRQTFFKPLERPRLLDAIRRHCAPRPG
jgi:two-component system chemotaxis response regulator CheY